VSASRSPAGPPPARPLVALRPHRSVIWSIAFRAGYRLVRVLDPLIRSWIANGLPGLGGIVELRFVGRRSGRARRTIVTLLRHGGAWYVGHPNGEAAWVRNVEAAGWVEIEPSGADGPRYRVRRLANGPERDAVIRATARQQPFPANLLYRAAQRHIVAVGVYHRLEPSAPDDAPTLTPTATGARARP
jgi:deazaflavin-dependent oxidoreductase (nitroreductase family)